jgi:serine/threonine protein kinase
MIDKSGHLKLIDFGLSKDGWKSKYTKASFRLPGEPGSEEALKPKKKKKNLLLRGWTATWSLFSRDKAADDGPLESARSDRSDKPRIRKNWSVVGSPEYMAVEILSQEGYDHLCDFWSLGVILYEFVFGATPFGAPTALQVFNNIKCALLCSLLRFRVLTLAKKLAVAFNQTPVCGGRGVPSLPRLLGSHYQADLRA